eukprot:COSAG01_NODE_8107_length_2918_cov_3.600568_3_plen_144_part_01
MVLEEAGSPPWDSAGRASNCLLFFFRSASILPTTALSATTAPASRLEPTLRAASALSCCCRCFFSLIKNDYMFTLRYATEWLLRAAWLCGSTGRLHGLHVAGWSLWSCAAEPPAATSHACKHVSCMHGGSWRRNYIKKFDNFFY